MMVATEKAFIVKVELFKNARQEVWAYVRNEDHRIEFRYLATEALLKKMMGRPKVYFRAWMQDKTLQLGPETQIQQW